MGPDTGIPDAVVTDMVTDVVIRGLIPDIIITLLADMAGTGVRR